MLEEVPASEVDTRPFLDEPRTVWQKIKFWTKFYWVPLRDRLPYLVWRNDEVDVSVTLKDIGALGGDIDRVHALEKLLREMEIDFDRGSGWHGRDWEWDFSLRGPISIRFRGRAAQPERRTLRPKPTLVATTPPQGGRDGG